MKLSTCGKSLSNNIRSGKTIPSWLGRKHTKKQIQSIRCSTVKYLVNTVNGKPRYNKSSIIIIENIAKEHNWNMQHAENIGEFYIEELGYFVDAYDKEKNIVLEYDEPRHYVDIENNILIEKDLNRQQEIIKYLHCEFWRYNEKTKTLWKVNL